METTLTDKGTIVEALWSAVRNSASLENVPGLVQRVIETEAWRCRVQAGKTYEHSTFVSFITDKPLGGCGWTTEKVRALLQNYPRVLEMFDRAATAPPGGDRKSEKATIKTDNIMFDRSEQGTSKAYTLSRLKREAPALFERVCKKELSANAAAIEAGFRRAPLTPFEQVQKLLPKLSADQIQELIKQIEALNAA